MPEIVRPLKAADIVADRLMLLIRNGEYIEGEKLPPERELATRFGVSRPTLRDAIRRLEMLGYLSVRQGDGTTIRTPSSETITRPFKGLLSGKIQSAHELMEFRQIIEPNVAALAAERSTSDLIEQLDQNLQQQRRTADRGIRLGEEDLQFHRLIATGANNSVIVSVLDIMRNLLQELRERALPGDRPALTIAEHQRIRDAIAEHDPTKAREAMAAHLHTVLQTSQLDLTKPTNHSPTSLQGEEHE